LFQEIAAENNLSETAFLVPDGGGPGGDGFHLRWFTPVVEVDLCGHATLAAACVVFERLRPGSDRVAFSSLSGPLFVARERDRLVLDFPSRPAVPCAKPEALDAALGAVPAETHRGICLLAVYGAEEDVRNLRPDFALLTACEPFGVIATAVGRECDFVSRFFAPAVGIPEDPVTGSAHCTLAPFWSARLGRKKLCARQVSRRGGELWVEDAGDRVRIAGQAVMVIEGTLLV
jgi:PhzF family phenazine biosynthesis protein